LTAALASSSAAASVFFGDTLPESQWIEAMTGADVALVTMKPGAEGVVMPSKTYSAMVAGQAILAVCPADSDLAATVLRHDAGWVIEPGDVTGLRNALDAAVARPEAVLEKRMNAFRAGHGQYDQSVIAPQWVALLTSRSDTSPARTPSLSMGAPFP
jgi:glycosyltransferase involved in cell wall biosynthesis